MDSLEAVQALPAFIALGAYAVLTGHKRSESLQLDESYLRGQLAIYRGIDAGTELEDRIRALQESLDEYTDMSVESDAINRETLWAESKRFLAILNELPEIAYLRQHYPGTCTVVPEWDPAPGGVGYGPRVYFFRTDDAPTAEDIIQRNIDGVVANDRERFERYQGHLHGYPECCIDFFHTRTADSPPEHRSLAPFTDHVNEEALTSEQPGVSLEERFPGFMDNKDAYGFFTREFYPEPGCQAASEMGRGIYDELAGVLPEPLVRDYYTLNFGWSYLMADRLGGLGNRRVQPGALGRDHIYFYLPLRGLLAASRYQ